MVTDSGCWQQIKTTKAQRHGEVKPLPVFVASCLCGECSLALLHSGEDFPIGTLRVFGQFVWNDDAERMFGDEGWNLPHLCAKHSERRDSNIIRQLFNVVRFGRSPQCAAQTIKRQLSLNQNFSTRLKIAERVEHNSLYVTRTLSASLLKKCRLAHQNGMDLLTVSSRRPDSSWAARRLTGNRRGRVRMHFFSRLPLL